MAKKMTAAERKQAEDLQKVLEQALDDCKAALKSDDEECVKAAVGERHSAVKAVMEVARAGEDGPSRRELVAGVAACRELGRKGGPQ